MRVLERLYRSARRVRRPWILTIMIHHYTNWELSDTDGLVEG